MPLLSDSRSSVAKAFTCTGNRPEMTADFLIADNVFEGLCEWPGPKKDKAMPWKKRHELIMRDTDRRAIQVAGQGHVVCHNRIHGFGDGLNTFAIGRDDRMCAAIDFYGNDISECVDDGVEMDSSDRNTRCFRNRLTNVYQGVSTQPVFGGPVYIFRNAMYNVDHEVFKMHSGPSGALMFHNTCVKKGMPVLLWTGEPVRNCLFRNNLFVGTEARYACEFSPSMKGCNFDYDGIGGGPWTFLLKWNGRRYKTIEDIRARAPVYRHAVVVDPARAFARGVRQPKDVARNYDVSFNDLRLKDGTEAIDAGVVLPNVNEDFRGEAPDLGAYGLGDELPRYGPRPEEPEAAKKR